MIYSQAIGRSQEPVMIIIYSVSIYCAHRKNTLNVMYGQIAVIFKLSLAIPLTFTGLNIRTVIAVVTCSNQYLHRMYEQDYFGRVHSKVTSWNSQIGIRINCLCVQH
jgi:hypothetical protein